MVGLWLVSSLGKLRAVSSAELCHLLLKGEQQGRTAVPKKKINKIPRFPHGMENQSLGDF